MIRDRRIAKRFDIRELTFVCGTRETRAGLLMNISRQGAQVEFSEPLVRTQHRFAVGEPVEIRIDELGELPANVSRAWDRGVALAFRIDGQQQEMLRAEILEAMETA